MSKTQKRTIIITGATKGIGLATVRAFIDNGDNVIGTYSSDDTALEETKKEFENRIQVLKCDVTDRDAIEKMVENIITEHGKIDVLINNAGVNKDAFLIMMPQESWDRVMEVNVKGTMNMCRAVLKNMIANRYGKIVNVSSVSGIVGVEGQTNYCASKAAVIGFTRALTKEVARYGINVNAVAPGIIMTEMTEKIPEDIRKNYVSKIPCGRIGLAQEVANVTCFLASELASYINGQVIIVDGGLIT